MQPTFKHYFLVEVILAAVLSPLFIAIIRDLEPVHEHITQYKTVWIDLLGLPRTEFSVEVLKWIIGLYLLAVILEARIYAEAVGWKMGVFGALLGTVVRDYWHEGSLDYERGEGMAWRAKMGWGERVDGQVRGV